METPDPMPAQPAPSALQPKERPVREMDSRELVASSYMLEQIGRSLPKVGIDADRFQRIVLTATTKNPKLLECTPQSLAMAVMSLAQVGLEPDGRHAHLIPRRNGKTGTTECQAQLDYKGLITLVRRSGEVATIHADTICENDIFEYDLGTVRRHVVDFRKPRGKPYAVYSMAVLKDGTQQSTVMTLDEINAIAERSNGVKAAKQYGGTTPWDTDWSEMAKKTVFRRLSKWLPLSSESAQAIREDEEREFSKVEDLNATPKAPQAPKETLASKLLAAPKAKGRGKAAPAPAEAQDSQPEALDGEI